MFTTDNTTGYTTEELVALNAELNVILADIRCDDIDAIMNAVKAFEDKVAARS